MKLEEANKIWGEEWTHDIDLINETIHYLGLSKDSTILDVGTGQGIMAINLALNGNGVLTGEPEQGSEEHQHYEKEMEGSSFDKHHEECEGHSYVDWKEAVKLVGVEDKIKYQHFNAEELPFPSGSFDGVFLYDALQHIKDRKRALNECIRVTKSNRIVCVVETNDNGIQYFRETEGFEIDKVDPRDLLDDDGVSVEILTGKFSNAYILRKI